MYHLKIQKSGSSARWATREEQAIMINDLAVPTNVQVDRKTSNTYTQINSKNRGSRAEGCCEESVGERVAGCSPGEKRHCCRRWAKNQETKKTRGGGGGKKTEEREEEALDRCILCL
uniref:Uncharacterized protein n=1 Tax=Oryza nivara TaxID=4536 RepID=A0A0E0GJG1_ORYNI